MEKLQKTFKSSYVNRLKEELKAGHSLEKYSEKTFVIDESMNKYVANVYQPEGLLNTLLQAENDFQAAVALYEAYKDISPVLASSEEFWAYLTHVDLFPYLQKRWGENLQNPSYIIDHWFFGTHGYIRNGLASLWWSVRCSYDEDNKENHYALTEILFKNYSFRTTFLSVMLRTKNGLLGILDFLNENQDVLNDHFENRGRFIAKYFNLLGATKQFSYLPREYFKNELEKIKPSILKVTSRDDIQNKDVFDILD